MANLSLSQLREVQKANPPSVDGEGRIYPPLAPSTEGSLPLQASPSVPAGGYCQIFPPEFSSILELPLAWKTQNWGGNGPWRHVEGAERHPDFESNLLAVETSPEVVGAFPGK